MLEVLSFGAGVQSTTLLCMSCDGVLPKLDAAIFADTQSEPAHVYGHLEWCKEKAAKAGIPFFTATAGNLRDAIIKKFTHGTRAAAIPFFLKDENGKRGIHMRQCTRDYKIDVVNQVIRRELLGLKKRQRWPTEPLISQWIGISSDEITRRRTSLRPAIVFRYPLLDEFEVPCGLFSRGYSRQDCQEWMLLHGYLLPSRSACTFCPYHSDEEWARMKLDEPKEFEECCNLDDVMRASGNEKTKLRGEPYLHSSLTPLRLVDFDPASDRSEGRGMANECEGMCGI